MTNQSLPKWHNEFSTEAKALTEPEIGLKLIATVDSRGWPHITMISFNKAKTTKQVVWGQFVEGLSKKNVLENPKQGVFYMNAEMPFKFVQAKVKFNYVRYEGEDREAFSQSAMLRYMAYVNVHTCYYNDVIAVTNVRNLPLSGILKSVIVNKLAVGGTSSKKRDNRLPPYGAKIFNQMTSVKVIAYIDEDDYPVIIPCLGLRAPDRSRLVFPLSQFGSELRSIPKDSHVAIYGIVSENLELTNMLVKGTYTGIVKSRGFNYGVIEIDEVYNSMPPLHGVIYPKLQTLPKITQFQ